MAAGRRTTDEQKSKFIAVLRKTGIVRRAAAAASLGYRTTYDLRAADSDFAAAWDDALAEAIGTAEETLRMIGVDGYTEREQFDKDGTLRSRVHRYDVKALHLFLAARDSRYSNSHKVELDANVKTKGRPARLSPRRDMDLKAEFEKLDKEGLAAMDIILTQLEDAEEKEAAETGAQEGR